MKARERAADVRYIHPYFRYREFNSPKLCRSRSSRRTPAILPSLCRVFARGMRSRIIPLNARRRSVNPAEKRTTCARAVLRLPFSPPVLRARSGSPAPADFTDARVARGVFIPDGLTSSITLIGFHRDGSGVVGSSYRVLPYESRPRRASVAKIKRREREEGGRRRREKSSRVGSSFRGG